MEDGNVFKVVFVSGFKFINFVFKNCFWIRMWFIMIVVVVLFFGVVVLLVVFMCKMKEKINYLCFVIEVNLEEGEMLIY